MNAQHGKQCKVFIIISWVKIVNDRILIFNEQFSSKAFLSYDIKESDIKGKVIEDNERISSIKKKFNSSYTFYNRNSTTLPIRKSLSLNNLFANGKRKQIKNDLIRNLNYVIEIDHAYMQRCFIKSKNIIDSIELYNQIMNLD